MDVLICFPSASVFHSDLVSFTSAYTITEDSFVKSDMDFLTTCPYAVTTQKLQNNSINFFITKSRFINEIFSSGLLVRLSVNKKQTAFMEIMLNNTKKRFQYQ